MGCPDSQRGPVGTEWEVPWSTKARRRPLPSAAPTESARSLTQADRLIVWGFETWLDKSTLWSWGTLPSLDVSQGKRKRLCHEETPAFTQHSSPNRLLL